MTRNLFKLMALLGMFAATSFGQIPEIEINRILTNAPLVRFHSIEFGGPSEVVGQFTVRARFMVELGGCTEYRVHSMLLSFSLSPELHSYTNTFRDAVPNLVCPLIAIAANVTYTHDFLELNQRTELIFTDQMGRRVTARFRIVEDGAGGYRLDDLEIETEGFPDSP